MTTDFADFGTDFSLDPTIIRVALDYANFRRAYARSFAETYRLAPPSTVYGMLLSLVGEYNRQRHVGVRLAFAYRSAPQKSMTMHKLTRYKFGVAGKQAEKGNVPEYIETLSDLDLLVAIDSSGERHPPSGSHQRGKTLADRVRLAIEHPERINRRGVLSLGLSDNMVNICELYTPRADDMWFRLFPSPTGTIDLPTWVDHGTSEGSRSQRFVMDEEPVHMHGVFTHGRGQYATIG
jgi:CRISPR-associated protein Cas5t